MSARLGQPSAISIQRDLHGDIGAAGNRNLLVGLRALLEADLEAVAENGMKAIREGRDVRALMSILERPRVIGPSFEGVCS